MHANPVFADLFLTCKDFSDSDRQTYHILTNKKDAGFSLALSGRLPPGAGQISFADMDRDGTIDLVFPSCTSDECFINIAYNQQMPLCSSDVSSNREKCRSADQLCQADPDFSFNLSPKSPSFVQLKLKDILPVRPYLVLSDSSFAGTLPLNLKLGDYNQDGYPDILLIASKSQDADHGRPVILKSIPCSSRFCGDEAAQNDRRMFESVREKVNVLEGIDDAKIVSFVDINEKVSLLRPAFSVKQT